MACVDLIIIPGTGIIPTRFIRMNIRGIIFVFFFFLSLFFCRRSRLSLFAKGIIPLFTYTTGILSTQQTDRRLEDRFVSFPLLPFLLGHGQPLPL